MDRLDPKFGKFPVIGLRTDYSHAPATELQVFRAARAKLTAVRMSPLLRRRLARAWILYPAYLFTEILVPWLRYSGAACKAFGHPRLRQLSEVARLTLNDGLCGRKGYYHGGLAEHRGGPELERYIHDQFHECLVIFCRYAVRQIYGSQPDLGDKHSLEQECIRAGLPCVTSFAIATPVGEVVFHGQNDQVSLEHETSIFIKPATGGQGKNIDRWDRVGQGYVNSNGHTIDSLDALLELSKTEARAIGGSLLLQQALVNSSNAEAYGSRALSTVRLVTLRTFSGEIIPVQAGIRLGSKPDAAVDNYHADGMYFHVDHDTGLIGTGFSGNFPDKPVRQTVAPLSKTLVTGVKVPRWDEICELGIDAHRRLTKDTICGWDLADTEQGLVIVECNAVPSMDVLSQQPVAGFLHTRFSQLLSEEIVYLLNQIEPEASPFRIRAPS